MPRMTTTDDELIEQRRRLGEGALGEWLMLRPNRFSQHRAGVDVAILGVLTLLLVPVGPIALVRAMRCADQYTAVGLPAPAPAVSGAVLSMVGTTLQIVLLYRVFLS